MNEKEETLEVRQDPYRLIDEEHNTWQCKVCGYIVSLEADGPYENGWNRCPACGEPVKLLEG